MVLQGFIDWIRKLFGIETTQKTQRALQAGQRFKLSYEDVSTINFTSIFANSIATIATADSDLKITDSNGSESRRSALIQEVVSHIWGKIKPVTAQALGKGGKFFVPYVSGDRILVSILDQPQCAVTTTSGDKIIGMSVLADTHEQDNTRYFRVVDYALDHEVLTIRNRVVDSSGREVSLENVSRWAVITPEITISGVERLPVGFLRCPRDARLEGAIYGVPITFGAEDTDRQLVECLKQIENEYKLKKSFVGVDENLFGKDNRLPQDGIFKLFRAGGSLESGDFWNVFDPAIRDSAYYARYTALCAQYEKEVGTSKGILTELGSYGATATEIRAAMRDTWAVVTDVRKAIENCINDLCYAVDLYAEHFGLTPAGARGDYRCEYDWDMSTLESTTETFDQLSELESRGLITSARLNSWVTGQTLEQAQAEIDEARAEQAKAAAVTVRPEELEPDADR